MTPAYLAKLAADHEKARRRLLSGLNENNGRSHVERAARLRASTERPNLVEIEAQLDQFSARMKKRPRKGKRRRAK